MSSCLTRPKKWLGLGSSMPLTPTSLMSHPILRTKLVVKSNMCPGISHTYKTTNYIVSSLEVITYRVIIHTKEQILSK
jgi:hypothetical protein